jgi:uncharacterized protein (DUF58 family)
MAGKLILLYQSFYLSKRTYLAGAVIAGLFAVSFLVPVLSDLTQLLLLFLGLLIVTDSLLLYGKKQALAGGRFCEERFSNGDENKVSLELQSNYSFKIDVILVDEMPVQFQERKWERSLSVERDGRAETVYFLRPTERGVYLFGKLHAFVKSPLQLVTRRFTFPLDKTVTVYPSYMQVSQYSLTAVNNRLLDSGNKRLSKLGNSVEFEQIKEYVLGDDYRTINWKATARKGQFMVNTYVDEKSQQVYCLIDKSRSMKMPFDGMSLLDYAINASLVLTNVALQKQDKAGIVTFAENADTFLPSERNSLQMKAVLEALYQQQTQFRDADFEVLYTQVRHKIKQRSLLVLFTNFESLYALERQLPYLRKIAHYHLLMVVFFENTEIRSLLQKEAPDTEGIYIQTIAGKFAYEKRQLVKELKKYGILSLLTTPGHLTINTVNKYLEIKARQAI